MLLFRIKDPNKGVLCVQVNPGTPEYIENRFAERVEPDDRIVRHLQNRLGEGAFTTNKGTLRCVVDDVAFLFPWKCWPVPEGYR